MPSTNGGTQPPIATAIPTPSGSGNVPTVFPSGAVPATPFRLTFGLTDSTEPNEFEFAMAGDLALVNLEAFLRDQFSNAFGITINVFDGMIAEMGVNPVTIDFDVEISFTMDSSFVPSQADIDALIEVAFLPPNVDTLIAEYNSLSADSPFSTTQTVGYEAPPGIDRDGLKIAELNAEPEKGSSKAETSLIVGASLLALVTSIMFMAWLKARRNRYVQVSAQANRKSDLLAIMPAYSYCDSRSSNLMQFKDENSTGPSDLSRRLSARSRSSSMSSHTSSSVSIRAI